jgi:hypothetical protein
MKIADLPSYLPSNREFKDTYYNGFYYFHGTVVADTTAVGGSERLLYMFKSTNSGRMYAFPEEFVVRYMNPA